MDSAARFSKKIRQIGPRTHKPVLISHVVMLETDTDLICECRLYILHS